MNKKKVVVLGGGNGSAVVLEALKNNHALFEISAVVAMSDSGRSNGKLRRAFKIPPPADILRAILALSTYDYALLKKIFYTNRLTSLTKLNEIFTGTTGTNIGSFFIAFAAQYEGDFVRALRALEEVIEAKGHAYPVTMEQAEIVAELDNGENIISEAAIDRPTYDRSHRIKRVRLEPPVPAYAGAIDVLQKADCIVIAPGSLYTSLVPALLPSGICDAIKQSSARLVYISALSLEKEGETGPQRLSEFVAELEQYLPRPLDLVVYNSFVPSSAEAVLYEEKQWVVYPKDTENIADRKVVGYDYEEPGVGYSAEKLSTALAHIFV